MLASAYGWSKSEILNNVYPDEIEYYEELILKKEVNNYRMSLLIQHGDSQALEDLSAALDEQINLIEDQDNDTSDQYSKGFAKLKSLISQSSGMQVK